MQLNVQKPTTPPTSSVKLSDGKFEFEELTQAEDKIVLTIVGDKGSGKTSLAFSLPGEIYCLSLDKKSNSIKAGSFNNDSRIHVVDALKYYVEEQDKVIESGAKSYDYMLYCLQQIKEKGGCDWIVVDGLKQFAYLAELAMRKKNNIKAFEGFKNLSLWKQRNLFLRRFHRLAFEIATKGVIYTTYFRLQEITDSKGEVRTEKLPNYTDIIMEETDIVVMANSTKVGNKRIYLAECDSSKRLDLLQSGKIYDVTGNKFAFGKEMMEVNKDAFKA